MGLHHSLREAPQDVDCDSLQQEAMFLLKATQSFSFPLAAPHVVHHADAWQACTMQAAPSCCTPASSMQGSQKNHTSRRQQFSQPSNPSFGSSQHRLIQ